MVEEDIGGGGGGNPSRVSTSTATTVGAATKGRQMFTVELKPGETTFVSWKKLIKEGSHKIKPNNLSSLPATGDAPPPPTGAHPALESRIAHAVRTNSIFFFFSFLVGISCVTLIITCKG